MSKNHYSAAELRALANEADGLADAADDARLIVSQSPVNPTVYVDWANRQVRATFFMDELPANELCELLERGYEMEHYLPRPNQATFTYTHEQ